MLYSLWLMIWSTKGWFVFTFYSISVRKQDFWLLEIGAPLEVVGQLSALTSEVEMNSNDRKEQPEEPELDRFFVTKYPHEFEVLISYI
jgi:hypothetical protein